jgi:hypothetical protein
VLGVDLPDGQIANDGVDVLLEGAAPLSAVCRVAPLGFAVGDHRLGGRAKCHAGELLFGTLASAVLDRVGAVEELASGRSREFARFSERHDTDGAKPH